jgi:DNA-binding beta-propeller fold protein YncE
VRSARQPVVPKTKPTKSKTNKFATWKIAAGCITVAGVLAGVGQAFRGQGGLTWAALPLSAAALLLVVAGGVVALTATPDGAGSWVRKRWRVLVSGAVAAAVAAVIAVAVVTFSRGPAMVHQFYTALDNPDALAISANGQNLYVADSATGDFIPIDIMTGQSNGSIYVGQQPVAIAINSEGTSAYVANRASDTVTPVNLKDGKAGTPVRVGKQPDAIAITPDGSLALVADFGSAEVTLIRLNPSKISATAAPIQVGPQPVAIAIARSLAYVVNQGNGTITPINLDTDEAESPITVGALPIAIAVAGKGSTAYVARQYNYVTPVALRTGTPLQRIWVNGRPIAIAVANDGNTAYVADWDTCSVTPIQLRNDKAGSPISLWKTTEAFDKESTPVMPIVVAPDGRSAYVANYQTGVIYKVTL